MTAENFKNQKPNIDETSLHDLQELTRKLAENKLDVKAKEKISGLVKGDIYKVITEDPYLPPVGSIIIISGTPNYNDCRAYQVSENGTKIEFDKFNGVIVDDLPKLEKVDYNIAYPLEIGKEYKITGISRGILPIDEPDAKPIQLQIGAKITLTDASESKYEFEYNNQKYMILREFGSWKVQEAE